MPVESPASFKYISDLDPSSPSGNEKISDGDDHIRNIKKAITETFTGIDGEVTVGQDKLNELDAALPVAPTVDGSVLHNSGNKWSETNVIEIKGDAAFIPAFSGLGPMALYVDDNGQILAAERSSNPSLQHDIESHTDVNYQRPPREDDILVFNGSEWVNAPIRNGSMFKVIDQPATAGDYISEQAGVYYVKDPQPFGDYVFTVPDGLRFCLASASMDQFGNAKLIIDGVEHDLDFYGSTWPPFSDSGAITFEVKESISFINSANGNLAISGYFFEA